MHHLLQDICQYHCVFTYQNSDINFGCCFLVLQDVDGHTADDLK